MYLDFFNIKHEPFALVSDPRLFYYSESHCEAIAHVLYGIRERKGVMLLIGETGTGKSTLLSTTLELLGGSTVVPAVISNPLIGNAEELLETILREWKLSGFRTSTVEMFDVLKRFLTQQVSRAKVPVLVVDEAQMLSDTILEQLRLLSNIEVRGQKAIQLVLAGQPELNDRIATHQFRAFRQRVAVRCQIRELSAGETLNYMHSRMLRAGCTSGANCFTQESVETIYVYTGGTPRLINVLADNCLLAAYARGQKQITAELADSVANHLEFSPTTAAAEQADTVKDDILRAAASYQQVARDLASASAPSALREFVNKLKAPAADAAISAVMGVSS